MPESPNPGQSYEAWISSKAGASPPDIKVWICPDCGSAERYDDPQLGDSPSYVPFCEWCDDDPEGRAGLPMVLHVAVPARDWPGGMPKPPPYPADDEAQ